MNKVSIILPVYNSEKYIEKTINSIIKQTYKDFELIIIDDQSTDRTYEICKKMQKTESRIKLLKNANKGVSSARNVGINEAEGKYLMFIDSDDLYDEKMLEILCLDNLAECTVCFFEKFITEKNIKKRKKYKIPKFKKNDELIGFLHKRNLFNVVWNKIYLNEIVQKNKINFDSTISIAEDLKFNLKYFNCINKINIVNESLYYYRCNENGLNLKKNESRINIRKNIYYIEKKMFINRKFDLKVVYREYLKICLAELKQINTIYSEKSEKNNKYKAIIKDSCRKKELHEIYCNSKWYYKVFIILLNNELMLKIFAKVIDVMKV